MVEEEKQLLLSENEDSGAFKARNTSFMPFQNASKAGKENDTCSHDDFLNFALKTEEVEPDSVVAVFVVKFDTRCGKCVAMKTSVNIDCQRCWLGVLPYARV